MGALKQISEKYLPRALNVSAPVVQVFVNSKIKSFYSFTNFPSLYSPVTAAEYIYKICLYDESGKLNAAKNIKVGPFGTYFFDPAKEFGENLPEWGMVTAKIKPANIFFNSDKHLGKITPQFYAMFADAGKKSCGVVHPQMRIKKARRHDAWQSNQIVETRNLKQIITYQLNPTRTALESTVMLTDEKGEAVASQQNNLPPLGSCRNAWDDFAGRENVSLKIDKMTVPNAKPLMFLLFDDDSFSVSHS